MVCVPTRGGLENYIKSNRLDQSVTFFSLFSDGVLLCSLGWWYTWLYVAFIYGLFEETISDLSIFLVL